MILEGDKAKKYIELNGKHFQPHEFMCKCGCGGIKIDTVNLGRLDYIRAHLGVPVIITSAYRCPKHNKAVGGVDDSYHTQGMAYDITVKDFKTFKEKIIEYAGYAGFTGIGINYDNFVHVDSGKRRKW